MLESPVELPFAEAPQPVEPVTSGRASRAFGRFLVLAAAAALLVLVAVDRWGWCPWDDVCASTPAEDITQGRLDTALPAPQGGLRIEQSFRPRRNGLSEVELILVRYGPESATAADPGYFLIELRDEFGSLIASEELPTGELSHNQTYTLRFPPQPDSTGRLYTLGLLGNDYNQISAWGYSVDVYQDGTLSYFGGWTKAQAAQAAADLRFVSRYELTWGDGLAAAAAPLREIDLLLVALLFLPLPGVLLLLAARPRGWDPAAWLGAALSLGMAVWPILWQWLSLAGWRWSGLSLWVVVAIGWAVSVGTWRFRRINRQPEAAPTPDQSPTARSRVSIHHILLAGLLLITIGSRFVAVRDQAFPPWVDSSRHALITAVMASSGRIPDSYEPLLPVDHFPYHYGFHTLSASLALMTGHALPALLLFLMQLLGGLLPLAVYAAGWIVTRRRGVGLLAAFLVALPFFFPGYYATWGRMTQLAAMVIMPVLLALTWRLGRGWPRFWPLVGVLAAGVFLVHFRVFLFYIPFAVLTALIHLLTRRRWVALLKAGGLALLLVLPRLNELLTVIDPVSTASQSLPGYNDFPLGYITTGWERAYLIVAGMAAVIVLVAVFLRRRWATFPLLLLLWAGALFAMLAGERLGLPESLVVNLNSMYITLFLPLALLLAIVVDRAWGWAGRLAGVLPAPLPSLFAAAGGGIAGVGLAILLLFGWRQQANILNPQTILALPEDVAALDWINSNLPSDARVGVSAWQWLGSTWAGSDGGAWLVPITGREATTPPVDHIYNPDLFAAVRAFNETASVEEDWSTADAAGWLATQGVTHVFVGQRGGYFDPAELSRNPALKTVYHHQGTFVFALK